MFVILSVVLTLLVAFAVPVTISYANSMDDMIPTDKTPGTLYNKYSPSHYSFQTLTPERHFWEVGAQATDSVNSVYDHGLSMVFLGGVQVTRFFNFIAREAFTFSFMDSLIDGVEEIIQGLTGINGGNLGSGLWGSMFGIFATITLAYVLWQVVRLRFLDSLQTMFSFVLALVVALAFFANAGSFLRLMNDGGNELAATMYKGLAAPGGLSTSTTTGVQAISEQMWMELVMKPYGMLQFDDSSAYENHPNLVDKVLKTDPYSAERVEALRSVKKTFPAVEKIRSDEQMIILLCNAIFSAIILGLSCFWAIATIFMRIKLLIHAIIMSVTLLASLLPGREASLSVVRGQFIKLIGLVMMTVFTMLFLDLSLVAGHMVFNIVYKANAGWFTAMLLETIVVFVIFKYRTEIGSVFSKAAGHIPMVPKAKSTVLDAVQRNVTRSLYNKAGASVSSMFSRKEPEGVPSTFNPNSISKAGDSLNDATTASMQLRYQREKDAAEQVAAETGQPVQYTPYVQKVNENLRNNVKNPFRGMDKEWKDEKSRLSDIKKDGGDVKQAILTQGVNEGMNDQQVAATMYANENAIRQASTFMVNRPKSAINQIQRAGTLNKNRKLETSVNDFIMVELFERYKVEYKRAIDTAALTGNSVDHTDFVKNMDGRFKAAGLNTTEKVNVTMQKRSGRISVASHFNSMPEFVKKRDDLLAANEAFRKAAASQTDIPASVKSVNPKLPLSAINVLSTAGVKVRSPQAPLATAPKSEAASALQTKKLVPLSKGQVLKELPTVTDVSLPVASPDMNYNVRPKLNTNVDAAQVKLPNDLKKKITQSKEKIAHNVARSEFAERIVLNNSTSVRSANRIDMLNENKVNMASSVDMSKVKMPDSVKHAIEEGAAKIKNGTRLNPGDEFQVRLNKDATTKVIVNLKNKVTTEVSTNLDVMNREIELMKKANGRKLQEAQGNKDTENVVKKNTRSAQQTRKPVKRSTVE
ncbi:CD3337/EF1877 family mobilome membrane protein [Paenibacillus sp. D51F]